MQVLIVLALLGAAFAAPQMFQRIVGGTPTEVEQYPFMSNMQYAYFSLYWSQLCGGSLITSSTILSAAHCYYGDDTSHWRVRLGTSFASSGGKIHSVSAIIIHPRYDVNEMINDIAIIKLSTPAVYSQTIQNVGIAGSDYYLPDNSDVVTVGWGSPTASGSLPWPEQLQHLTIQTINQELCAERYAYLKTLPNSGNMPDITDEVLCAGILDVGSSDACQGDSGGPIVHNGKIVGIVSWRYSCADSYYPGVNSRVSAYANWIIQNGSS